LPLSKHELLLGFFDSTGEGSRFRSWVVHGLEPAKNMLGYVREKGPATNTASSSQGFAPAW